MKLGKWKDGRYSLKCCVGRDAGGRAQWRVITGKSRAEVEARAAELRTATPAGCECVCPRRRPLN